jgi:hypothetical protein
MAAPNSGAGGNGLSRPGFTHELGGSLTEDRAGRSLIEAIGDERYDRRWLLLGSGVVMGTSRHQSGDKGSEQGFTAAAGVVHELEEAKAEWQLLLRDAPVWPQPGAQQRPDPFHGVDVDLTEAVAVLIAGVFAPSMADRLVTIAPGRQASVDLVLVGVDEAVLGGRDDRLDRGLLHIGQSVEDQLATPLDQAEDGRLLLFQRAAARRSRQPAAAAEPPLLATAPGWPLCPATT